MANAGAAIGFFLLGWTIFTAYMTVAAFRVSGTVAAVFVTLLATFILLTTGAYTGAPRDQPAWRLPRPPHRSTSLVRALCWNHQHHFQHNGAYRVLLPEGMTRLSSGFLAGDGIRLRAAEMEADRGTG